MHAKSKKYSKSRYLAPFLISAFLLTGCGTLLAGTPVDIGGNDSVASGTAHIKWFDGSIIRENDITVGQSVDIKQMPFEPDVSHIAVGETQTLRCFQVQSTEDITGLYDMQVLDEQNNPLIYVNTVYDGAVYPLGKSWYAVVLPNGYDKSFHLRIGNTCFVTK